MVGIIIFFPSTLLFRSRTTIRTTTSLLLRFLIRGSISPLVLPVRFLIVHWMPPVVVLLRMVLRSVRLIILRHRIPAIRIIRPPAIVPVPLVLAVLAIIVPRLLRPEVSIAMPSRRRHVVLVWPSLVVRVGLVRPPIITRATVVVIIVTNYLIRNLNN